MKTKKELYMHLAENLQIFLPSYQLDLVWDDMIKSIRNKESVFTILYRLEQDKELRQYNNKAKGAYTIESEHLKWSDKSSKGVVQMNAETGEVIKEHKSIYSAAKSLGLSGDNAGNISRACTGKSDTAYGFKWKFINK